MIGILKIPTLMEEDAFIRYLGAGVFGSRHNLPCLPEMPTISTYRYNLLSLHNQAHTTIDGGKLGIPSALP